MKNTQKSFVGGVHTYARVYSAMIRPTVMAQTDVIPSKRYTMIGDPL